MEKTNSGLVEYAKAQLGLPYWYGTYGQKATLDLYNKKKAQYPGNYTANDFISQIGKRVHDCVGLVKGYLWSESVDTIPKYNSTQDKSAKGMYYAASEKEKGSSDTFPGYKGTLLFKSNSKNTAGIHHVGVYGGDGYVYEAKGHKWGVVKTPYVAKEWQYWAQCPYIKNDIIVEAPAEDKPMYYDKYDGESRLLDTVFYAIGVESKFIGNKNARKPLAVANGIDDYAGTATQNLKLIKLAKNGVLKRV